MALSTIRGMTVSTHREFELVSSPNGQSSFLHTNQGQAGPSQKKAEKNVYWSPGGKLPPLLRGCHLLLNFSLLPGL